jgi:hypothetical protein
MKKIYYFILIISFLFVYNSVKAQQQELYTFCTGGSYAYLIDTAGSTSNFYKRWTLGSQTSYSAYLSKDTVYQSCQYTVSGSPGQGGTTGRVRKIDWNGNVVWQYDVSTSTTQMHHDICPMPNGNVMLIVYEEKSASPSTVGCSQTLTVWSEKIIEVKPTGSTTGTIVWEWHLWDHLCQSQYSNITSTYVSSVSQHPELMNVNYSMTQDWIHMNGIDYNPTLDQIALSSHYMDEVYIIDHSTTTAEAATHSGGNSGKGGDFLYRWGNPAAYGLSGSGNNSGFNVIHDAHWIPSTNPDWPNYLCAYNNNQGGNVQVVIWNPPYNGYNYTYTPGSIIGPTSCIKPTIPSMSVQDMGNSQQLDNGNILVTKPGFGGGGGAFYECNGSGTTYQSVTVGTNHAYRLKKCDVRWANATASTSLTDVCVNVPITLSSSVSSAPSETSPTYTYSWSSNPSTSSFTSPAAASTSATPTAAGTYIYSVIATNNAGCSDTATVQVIVASCTEIDETIDNISDINLFPNPTTGVINLDEEYTSSNNFEIFIYNTYGKIIAQGKNLKTVDLSEFSNGIYFVTIQSEDMNVINKKIILIK